MVLLVALMQCGCGCPQPPLVELTSSQDSVEPGVEEVLVVGFPELAFLEAPNNSDSDRLVYLGDSVEIIGVWQSYYGEFHGAIVGVQVLDAQTIEIRILIDADNESEDYTLVVAGDRINGCLGPLGVVTLASG